MRKQVYAGTDPPGPGRKPELGYAYSYAQLPRMRAQLLKGGVRLAGRLNAAFAGLPAPPPPGSIPTDHQQWCAPTP